MRSDTPARLRLSVLLLAIVALCASTPRTAIGAARAYDEPPPAAPSVDAVLAANILSVARQAVGTYQGECFPWVRRVVAQATGAQMGFGYRDGYLSAGATEVPLSDARGGDVIQIVNDADAGPSADYPGLHAAIVADALGAGLFNVIDSNLGFDGIVRVRENYNPMALAGRYAALSVHVYRFTGTGGPTPGLEPPQSTQLIGATPAEGGTTAAPQQATSRTAVIRSQGDCLRLRSAPSTSAPVLTCLTDGRTVTLLEGSQQADGVLWQSITVGGQSGWVASQYLVQTPGASAPPPAATPPPSPASVTPQPVAAATTASIIGDLPAGGGLALVVFSGGSQDSLISAIRARGCGPVSVWTSQTGGGALIGMIVGAPSVVNRDWSAQFPDSTLAASSPLIVVCGSTGGGPPTQLVAQPTGSADRGAGPPGPAGNE